MGFECGRRGRAGGGRPRGHHHPAAAVAGAPAEGFPRVLWALNVADKDVPVVGGHAGTTTLPLLSQARAQSIC